MRIGQRDSANVGMCPEITQDLEVVAIEKLDVEHDDIESFNQHLLKKFFGNAKAFDVEPSRRQWSDQYVVAFRTVVLQYGDF